MRPSRFLSRRLVRGLSSLSFSSCLALGVVSFSGSAVSVQDVVALKGAKLASADRWLARLNDEPLAARLLPASDSVRGSFSQSITTTKKMLVTAPLFTQAASAAPKIDRTLKGDRLVRVASIRFGNAPTEDMPQTLPVAVDEAPAIALAKDIPFALPDNAKDSPVLMVARWEKEEARVAALSKAAVAKRRATILAQRKQSAPLIANAIARGEVSLETTGNTPKTATRVALQQKLDAADAATLMVSAYAAPAGKPVDTAPFKAVLQEATPSIIPTRPTWRPKFVEKITSVIKLGRRDHKWAANALPRNSRSAAQRRCLAIGIYFEARGEPNAGQQAVAQVILNRVKNPAYPRTICGVVYQNKHKRNACQFSFTCDGIRDKVRSRRHWKQAKTNANNAIDGRVWLTSVGSSTHYHADYVWPRWRKKMKRLTKIGRHIFYRTYGGGWS